MLMPNFLQQSVMSLVQGGAKSYEEAIKWYRKAAEQGSSAAQRNLAYCYEKGKGIAKNIDEAVAWYRKAANQGDNSAMESLERLTK